MLKYKSADYSNNSKRLLLPVFYDVDPSDIRKQSGCISDAFSKHEEIFQREVDDLKRKDLMHKMTQWRTALTQVANLGGMALQNLTNGYESKFILKIVNAVKDKVTCNMLSITPRPVGIDASVKTINLWVRNGSPNVEVFALYGIGGVGKTTIAKYVYYMNLRLFEGGSFLENIREYSERSDGFVCLQRQLLSDISKGKTPTINNINDGILKIQGALCHRKLLIMLDDVDQSMGREIIRQQSPRDPGKRSRLWHHKDSLGILKEETGTGSIEGLALDMSVTNGYQTELRTEAFSMMHKLRLLKLNNVRLSGGYKEFPKKLKWLCWQGYPLRCLANDFPLSSLVEIDMQSSKLQTFVLGNMLLGSLKYLNLSHCHCIVQIPKFAQLPALEELILEDCASLVKIDKSIQMAEGLVILNLKDCKLLKKLPKNIGMLKLLETLIISGCSDLCMLPVELRKMESLKVFQADGLNFGNSSSSTPENESKMKIGPQLSLTSLPCNYITRLSLVNCNLRDTAFPKDFYEAPLLEYLNLSNNPIHVLPDCFKGLKRLQYFYSENCYQLQALEDLPDITNLVVTKCPLLERIRCKPGASLKYFFYPLGCEKLLEMEGTFKVVPIGKIDAGFIKDCGIDDVESMKKIQIRLYNNYTCIETRCPIQGVYDNQQGGNAFSIFYPGSGAPLWFASQRNVPSVSFIVSSHSKLRYMNTCIVYNFRPDSIPMFNMIITNKTKDKMIIYSPSCYGIPEGDQYMTWLSHWKFGCHEMGPGDEVNILILDFECDTDFEVKEIGVDLVYEEQKQAGVNLAKRQKIQQICDETSQYVIPVDLQPEVHNETTKLYFVGSNVLSTYKFVRIFFGGHVLEETGERFGPDSGLD
ncbi:hypothetical protein POM88_034146 [Heracleum sosnowskyi]|uniref:TIR domain-containing protein n=1 Tax=Heracleum sosnowskyi TaxID=360622 RepID=A0AAD8HKP0_9APIA|nr:hypothetical protein POM88_034146 [Heracleum sosnowskyi]